MSAQEFKAAFDAGRAAAVRGEKLETNPYSLAKPPHPLDPPPDRRRTLLAGTWVRGWRKGLDDKAQARK